MKHKHTHTLAHTQLCTPKASLCCCSLCHCPGLPLIGHRVWASRALPVRGRSLCGLQIVWLSFVLEFRLLFYRFLVCHLAKHARAHTHTHTHTRSTMTLLLIWPTPTPIQRGTQWKSKQTLNGPLAVAVSLHFARSPSRTHSVAVSVARYCALA